MWEGLGTLLHSSKDMYQNIAVSSARALLCKYVILSNVTNWRPHVVNPKDQKLAPGKSRAHERNESSRSLVILNC